MTVAGSLRRVADLVARGAERMEVLDAVVAEAFVLFGVDFTALLRYERGGSAVVVSLHRGPPGLAVGERTPHVPDGLVLRVFHSGRPVRVDSYADVPGAGVARMHELGILAGAAAPILVDGRLWGVLAAMTRSGPVAAGLEHRLADFAEIAATAIAGAEAKDQLRELAGEQAALRRVAELAARGAEPGEVFEMLAVEASTLLHGCPITVARFDADGAVVVAGEDHVPVGWRAGLTGDDPAARTGVAVPINVDGRVWGMLAATSAGDPLPPGTERRLSQFAEIAGVATSSAIARADLHRIADELAALRRVAELVAGGAGEQQLFDAVTDEAAALNGDEATLLVRFVGERRITVLANHGGPAAVGTTVDVPLDDEGVVAEILRTGRPARLDDYRSRSGPSYARTDFGVGSSVGVPIVVDNRMWGVLGVLTSGHRLPADTEQKLQRFAELVAAALANSQARATADQLAGQQAAVRQVAELAARDAPADRVLEAVAVQASKLAGVEFTTVLRYEPDGSTEIMALSGAPSGLAIGMRAPGDGDGAVQRVWRTHRSARIDDLAAVSGRWPRTAHNFGFTTSAAVPILIQGELWGTLVVVGRGPPLSAAMEGDLASFAELAGTAIASAQARQEVRALADEQAAFRRVAELVAHGTPLDDVFGAVTFEASKLLGGLPTALHRGDPEPSGTADLAVPVIVEGRVWGGLTTTTAGVPLPAGTGERLRQFAELAAAAIANAENKAQLTASRARVVATADETRRRLQRDVHDGAQQRLVQTIITLKLARDAVAKGGSAGDRVIEALYHAERANSELRDLVHGIMPASLTQGGLRTGLESLIDGISIPVRLHLTAPPLPTETETTAYFIVAEALTNVVKHARATHADVTVGFDGATLSIEVCDDGIGGADPAAGSGLTGLSDRVGAAGGTLGVIGAAGHGTTVRAAFPLPQR